MGAFAQQDFTPNWAARIESKRVTANSKGASEMCLTRKTRGQRGASRSGNSAA